MKEVIRLPQYTKKDVWIFAFVMPFVVMLVNVMLFDERYFTDIQLFLFSSLIVLLVISITWILFTLIAVLLRNRFTEDKDIMKRNWISIFFFALIGSLSYTAIFYGYDHFKLFNYSLNESHYHVVLIVGIILNIFTTFLHEGISGFEKWKATLTETEQLKKEYMQSQLLGLKSQMNPHFLFNSLNSLSSLINEDPSKAEIFLNEMSKVYRYLLRNNEEQLVDLKTELQFIRSYYHIISTRYGAGIKLNIDVTEEQMHMLIAPLTIQILFENVYTKNSINKNLPLEITIRSLPNGWLQVKNNIQQKIIHIDNNYEPGIENIIKKVKLLCNKQVMVRSTGSYRFVEIPLIHQKEKQWA